MWSDSLTNYAECVECGCRYDFEEVPTECIKCGAYRQTFEYVFEEE